MCFYVCVCVCVYVCSLYRDVWWWWFSSYELRASSKDKLLQHQKATAHDPSPFLAGVRTSLCDDDVMFGYRSPSNSLRMNYDSYGFWIADWLKPLKKTTIQQCAMGTQ